MSWLKAAGNYASGAMKAATSIVAPPSQRSTRSQLRDHVTYIRSFAESSEQVAISHSAFQLLSVTSSLDCFSATLCQIPVSSF
jgi:hypothetical protein